MKNIFKPILLATLFLTLGISLKAQEKIKVQETKEKINDYSGNALKVVFTLADEKTISKEWKKAMKGYKASVDIKGSDIIATEVSIKSISEFPIQVFATVKKNKDKQNEFYAIFINGDQSVSSNSDVSGFTSARSIVENFANELSKESAKDFQDIQIGLLKDFNKELKDNQKETEESQEKIKDNQKEIKELEDKIKENGKKKEELLKKIETQKESVEDAKKAVGLYK